MSRKLKSISWKHNATIPNYILLRAEKRVQKSKTGIQFRRFRNKRWIGML